MSSPRDGLATRIRAALATQPAPRERPMFGVLAFLVDERMVVGARKNGDLLVRVDPARCDIYLARPGARIAEMGAGRTMGPSWLEIAGDALDGEALAFWIAAALDFHARETVR